MDREFVVEIEKDAEEHIRRHKKSGNKASLNKIIQILEELKIHPYTGTGQPERLKHNLSGFWSRRINQKDRMIYRVEEHIVTVFVVSAIGHYDEK
ncbi:MAG: Txe/YoeB family addiction module toxin [Bergeyella sp.]